MRHVSRLVVENNRPSPRHLTCSEVGLYKCGPHDKSSPLIVVTKELYEELCIMQSSTVINTYSYPTTN